MDVEMRGIRKRFAGVQALSDVSMRIEQGSIHGLIGENGAGKSTLGKILAGVIQPDEGEIRIDGQCVNYRTPRDALADGITMIAQELTLEPKRSVVENVFLGIESKRVRVLDRRKLRARFSDLVERSGLALPPEARVETLRMTDQQKVEILRALARDARLIVMDEPTAALAQDDAQRLLEEVRGLRGQGTTIVYVTHFLREVLSVADTVTVLRDGSLVRSSPASEETPESLVTAMLGRPGDVAFPEKTLPPHEAPVICSVKGFTRPGVIEDISLEVRAGEIVGLAGLIGSGRSEVARAIFGADRPASGVAELDGTPVRIRSPRDAIKKGIVLVPESRKEQGLLLLRSTVENITLPHLDELVRARVIALGREKREATALAARLDIRASSLTAPVATLSGGNQQKVLFAKWLFRRPRLLIADEPTRGVDVGAKRAIYELIASVAREGMGVLFISSELEEVVGLAHRVVVLRNGRIVAEFAGDSATEDAVMRAAFATAA